MFDASSAYGCDGSTTISISISISTVQLLHPGHVHHRWLPVVGTGMRARVVVDSDGPRRLPVEHGDAYFDERLILRVEVAPHSPTTAEQVTVGTSRSRVSLRLGHTNWCQLGLLSERAVELRVRFCAAWEQSFRCVREFQPTRGSVS